LKIFRESGDSANIAIPVLNMGECYYYLNNPDVAVDYIRQALVLARKYGDNIFEARGLMLLGMIRVKQQDYTGAIAYMNQSLDLQKSAGNYMGPAKIQCSEVLVKLGDAWYQNGDMQQALKCQWEGYSLARSMKQLKQTMLSALSLSLIHKRLGKHDSSLYYHIVYATLLDSLSRSGTVRTVKLLEVRQEYEKRQKEDEMKITLAKSAKRTQTISYIAIGAGLLAVILVLFLMLKLERQKKAKSEMEKIGLHEKLEFKNNELTTNVMYLTKMNEMVMMVAKELRKMNLDERTEDAKIVQSITNELERVTNPENWKEFETRFQQVHTEFYKKLGDKFPDLSPNELKLCAFLRLNMSTKEISSITFQSLNSIQVARFRLRQKLGIDKEENLAIFLSQL
jgi:tetratricopeptide (TPR) repeat protein